MNLKEYLFTLKVQELKEICKNSNIIGVSKMKKSALVETMSECELNGIPKGLVLEKSAEQQLPVVPEEPEQVEVPKEEIILHLPIKPDALNVSSEKWLNMFKKGKKILENGNAHSH